MIGKWKFWGKRSDQKAIDLMARGEFQGDESSELIFSSETSTIYDVPLSTSGDTEITFMFEETTFTPRRTFWMKLFGFRFKAYIVDFFPGFGLEKEIAIIVINTLTGRPVFQKTSLSGIAFNQDFFPLFDVEYLRKRALLNPETIQEFLFTPEELALQEEPETFLGPDFDDSGEEILLNQTPLQPNFPKEDQPIPDPKKPVFPFDPSIKEKPVSIIPPTAKPTLLFSGLCFEESNRYKFQGLITMQRATIAMTHAFQKRGYKSSYGIAGKRAPDGGKADTFGQMMAGLQNSLDLETKYCKDKFDQLVIFVTGHGWNSSDSPEKDVSIIYDTDANFRKKKLKDKEFVTYQELFSALASIKKITDAPEKVYVIIDSCRSNRVSEGGVIPTSLLGIHLLVSDNSNNKCIFDALGFAIRSYLNKGGNSWLGLILAAKYQGATNATPNKRKFSTPNLKTFPSNSITAGSTVSVKLNTIKYAGKYISAQWYSDIRIDSLIPNLARGVGLVTGKSQKVKTLAFFVGMVFTANKEVYAETLWPDCKKMTNISLQLNISLSNGFYAKKMSGTLTVPAKTGKYNRDFTFEFKVKNRVAEMEYDFTIEVKC